MLRMIHEVSDPLQQAVLVRMAAEAFNFFDSRKNFDGLPEQLDFSSSVHKASSEGSHRLVTGKQDGTFRTPEVVL